MENLESPEDIEKELRELQKQKEDIAKKAKALQIKKNAIKRDQAYGPRKPVNLEIPVEDDIWLEEYSENRNLFKYELLIEAIELLRRHVEGKEPCPYYFRRN